MSTQVDYSVRADEARRNVPEMIRLLLAVNAKTAKELAQALGMSEGRLSERLSGKTRITSEELAVVALFLNVDEGVLYRDPESVRRVLRTATTLSEAKRLLLNSPAQKPAREAA